MFMSVDPPAGKEDKAKEELVEFVKSAMAYLKETLQLNNEEANPELLGYSVRIDDSSANKLFDVDHKKREILVGYRTFSKYLGFSALFSGSSPNGEGQRDARSYLYATISSGVLDSFLNYSYNEQLYGGGMHNSALREEFAIRSKSFPLLFGALCAYGMEGNEEERWQDFASRTIYGFLPGHLFEMGREMPEFGKNFSLKNEVSDVSQTLEKTGFLQEYVQKKERAIPAGASDTFIGAHSRMLGVVIALSVSQLSKSEVEQKLSLYLNMLELEKKEVDKLGKRIDELSKGVRRDQEQPGTVHKDDRNGNRMYT